MNIGIFTIFDAYNYGCFLQAFAMQKFLEQRGHQVYIVDVRTSLKSVIVQKYLAKNIKRSLLKLHRFFAYRIDWKKLNIVSACKYPELDIALIGSDEIWNIENKSFDHSQLYYGVIPKANKVIAYAPSLGYSTLKSYENCQTLCSLIRKNIKWFGVRDSFTADFLNSIGVHGVNKVCDPTILLYDDWRIYEKPLTGRIYPYLIYYSYKEDTLFKNYIKRFAEDKGLKIITLGFNYKWCDQQIIASPLEFISWVKNASYIVTSTFHGTLFSTMYGKKFVLVEPARKVLDFLDQIKLSKVADINAGYETFKILLEQNIDYERIRKKFDSMRASSVKLLKSDNGI